MTRMAELLRERPAAKRVLGAAVVVLVVLGVVAVMARSGGDGVSGAGRLDTDGSVLLTRTDGSTVTVTSATTLHDGDVVEAREGTMTVKLPGGATLEGRAGGDRADATKLRAGPTSELLAGELLVTAPQRTTVDVAGNHVTSAADADGPAATRLARSLAVRVGSYRGSAALDSAGQERAVPALREIEVAVLGRPPTAPKPMSLDHPDGWDRRFLADAIDLGQTLQAMSNAYSPTLRAEEGRTAAFYQNVLPALGGQRGFDDALVQSTPTRPQGELLIGTAIAALGKAGDLPDRWRSTFAFRDAGAPWGLVALDQHVAGGPLLDAVKAAVDHTAFQFAAATPTPPTAPVTVETTPPRDQPAATTTTSTTSTTRPPSSEPTPTTAPVTVPAPGPTLPPVTLPPPQPPSPGSGGVGGLVDTVGQLLGGLLAN